ncbi:ATP-binding cassette sub-family F member 2 [Toxocara canis]|uniref:ATP-binding cassette sub-family F member 2 n=1 Tax=Toxocara canis TaxID=6265 RepID=A0A0B2W2J0_TOXCA|nr:ATP-binding cassette sub-family F member 2 [Toxocara canis]
MPSDAKKRRDAAKKLAAKARNKARDTKKDQDDSEGCGTPTRNDSPPLEDGELVNSDSVARPEEDVVDVAAAMLEKMEIENAQARSAAGALTSHPKSMDIKIEGLTVTFHGREIVTDTKLELNMGRRYGLIGLNGSGKSTLMQAIFRRELPIPEHVDMFLVSREMAASNDSALKAVIDVDVERKALEKQAEELASCPDDEAHEKLMDIYDRLEEMDADKAEVKAAEILFGLGFTRQMMLKKCKDFSGGWRMRIALARALYLKPSLLLLDEPTNHLDLEACVWLEEELSNYKRTLLIVSHSQDFMNGVCTNIIHLFQRRLEYYGGNYDAYVRTREELLENQQKRYKWEQDQLQHMKDYIARFGHGSAKLARQAQSKEKTMAKMVAGGLTEKVVTEKVKQFYFFDPGPVPPPVIMVQHVSFRYSDTTPFIYNDLDFGIDLDTRIALVGPNGAGKSTLLKLISGDHMPTDGLIRRHSHVKIGRYHQHLHEELPLEKSALEFMMMSFPNVKEKEEMRKIIGRYGLTGREQICPMKQLSDGQRCRVSFAWLAWQQPHLLLLDEPTNHLDMESIDALAEAINCFSGGMILVSHDFRLVHQVAEEIWICDHQTVTKWDGDIFSYKKFLRKRIDHEHAKAVER